MLATAQRVPAHACISTAAPQKRSTRGPIARIAHLKLSETHWILLSARLLAELVCLLALRENGHVE